MLRVTVLERGRLVRGGEAERAYAAGTPARRELAARLYDRLMRSEAAREDRGEKPVFAWRRHHALVGSWVGVVQVPGLQIEILPKTDDQQPPEPGESLDAWVRDTRANLFEMLLRGGLGAVRARGLAQLALRRATLHDQLVDAFLDRLLEELRRGLDRAYHALEDNLGTLRGKLVFHRHVAKNAAARHRFYCRHDVLSEATPISVRLRRACRVLAHRALPPPLMVKCQHALAILDDVPEVAPDEARGEPVFNRQNERFRDVYAFACVVLEGQAPDARAGEVETFSLLFDMEKVFERYVAAFSRSHVLSRVPGTLLLPQGRGLRLGLFESDSRREVLRLAPDLLFEREAANETRRFIVDTKWKRLSDPARARPSDADLYQLYAYLRRYGCRRAVLLYPHVEGAAPRDLDALAGVEGQSVGVVGVRFVDVGKQKLWTTDGRQHLARELEALVREGLELVPAEAVENAERQPDAGDAWR
ncbi:MAG: hypothetical protein KF729_04570 [Sandaracinaceae bacterium]|nr:hypothetical protein [Sandaracinaceae bacterium]